MHKNQGHVYYSDYLKLNQFLGSQEPLSKKFATDKTPEAHDEMLFIIVHQAYELWFKQILHDLDSVVSCFQKPNLDESYFGVILQRLERITHIQNMLLMYLPILETMTPMDFLEFRNLLIPASGFQSMQFREIEIKLGLKTSDRATVDREFFSGRLSEADRNQMIHLETAPSLLKLMETWLERMPFAVVEGFNFWNEYQKIIANMLNDDEQTIIQNAAKLDDANKKAQLDNLQVTRDSFDSLFNEEKHQAAVQSGQRKISRKAILNGLFIMLYRDESLLNPPFQLLKRLMDIDENFTTWRYRHMLLAQRMLGSKIGTGGSSGHTYLKRSTEGNRVFMDLFNLSTYLIPRSLLPELPAELKRKLNF